MTALDWSHPWMHSEPTYHRSAAVKAHRSTTARFLDLARDLAYDLALALALGAVIAIAWLVLPSTACAESAAVAAPLPAYEQECGACHMAYPAGMLPAASWEHLLSRLDRHFGVNASLDPATERAIQGWLQQHAGTFRHAASDAPSQDRITHSRWWLRQHDEVSRAAFTRKAVGSASNCAACHPGATHGKFSERDVKIPR